MGHTGRVFVLALEGLMLLVLIAAAAYVSIGRILVTNVDAFQREIQRGLSNGLNVPVIVGEIRGDWSYVDPILRIVDLRVGATETPAINVGSMTVRIDAVASLREQAIVVNEVEVDGLRLDVSRDADGRWQIVNLPSRGAGFDIEPLVASIPYLRAVSVQDVEMGISGPTRSYRLRTQDNIPLALVDDRAQKAVSIPLSLEDAAGSTSEFELIGHYRGDPRDLEAFEADLYLQLPRLDLGEFLPLGDGLESVSMTVEGEFWLKSLGGNWQLIGAPLIDSLRAGTPDGEVAIASGLSMTFVVEGHPLQQLQVRIADIAGLLGDESLQLGDVHLAGSREGETWSGAVSVASIDLARMSRRALALGQSLGLVGEQASEIIQGLNLRGLLRDVTVVGELQSRRHDGVGRAAASARRQVDSRAAAPNFKLAARLEGVSIDSYRKSPIVRNVDGILVARPESAYLDLIDDGFAIGFPTAYDELWSFDSGRGRVAVDLSAGYPQVSSAYVRVADRSLQAAGQFQINLAPARVDRNWGLAVGVIDGDLGTAARYVPMTVDAGVRTWLEGSLTDGWSERAGMVFHGTLDRTAPKNSKAFELYFDVVEAELAFNEAWPPVETLDATVYVANRGIQSSSASGRMLGNDVIADVLVPLSSEVPANTVAISGGVTGELAAGLRVLQETPLAGATGNLAADWQGEGRYQGELRLDIPIGSREGQPVGADVSVTLDGNRLLVKDLDLQVGDINAMIRYQTEKGLSAPRVQAMLFDQPVEGNIVSQATPTGGAVQLRAQGEAAVADLYDWADLPLLRSGSGQLQYDFLLHVPYGDRAGELEYIEVTSDLVGVTVDLPAPLGRKSDDSGRQYRYRQSFLEEGYRVDVDWSELTRVSLKVVAGSVVGGRISFGNEPFGAVSYDKLRVTGQLGAVDYAEWARALDYLTPEDGEPVELAGTLDAISIDMDALHAFGLDLNAVTAKITREPGIWQVGLTNEMLAGRLSVPDALDPIGIDLDYLRFPAGADDGSDPLAEFDPTGLQAIDFTTRELRVGEENYGRWQFEFRPTPSGSELLNLEAEVKGLLIARGAKVVWDLTNPVSHSQFEGEIRVDDVAAAFKAWGFASSVEGQSFRMNANLKWPGSPAMIDLDSVNGTVQLHEGEGRFVQAESGTGALRLLGIFDFASIARRIRFDFSDVVNTGFSFSEISGRVRLDQGVVSMIEPMVIVGSGSTVKVGGTLNLKTTELDNDLVVTLPVGRNLPWYAAYSAIATGPLVGAGVWVAQKIFQSQIDQITSLRYRVEGTIDEPVVTLDSIFSDDVRQVAEEGESAEAEASPPEQLAEETP